MVCVLVGVQGGRAAAPPRIFQNLIFGQIKQVIIQARPKRNLLLFPVTRPTRQKAADSVNFMA